MQRDPALRHPKPGRRGFAHLLAALLLLGASAWHAAPWTARAAGPRLRIASYRSVEIDGVTRILSLSPDGRHLLVSTDRRQLCLYRAADLRRERCVHVRSIAASSIAWSPDGTRLAFTEDWARLATVGHIWVMDVAGGVPRNLSGNSVFGGMLDRSASGVPLDTVPAWSPDGTSLVFARSRVVRSETALYRIPAAGGTPRRLLTVAGNSAYALYVGMRWIGTSIVYTVANPDAHNPSNGLWSVEQDGQRPRQILAAVKDGGPPFLIDLTPDGTTALVYYAVRASLNGAGRSFFDLVDVGTGRHRPLAPAAPRFVGPSSAALSPDGTNVLYLYRRLGDPLPVIATRGLVGGGEQRLISPGLDAARAIGFYDIAAWLDWARGDTVYVASTPHSGLLLSLQKS